MNITRIHIQLPIAEIAEVAGRYLEANREQLLARSEGALMRTRDWRGLQIQGKGDHLQTRLLVRFETRLMGEVPSALRNLGQSMGVETLDFELEIFLDTRIWLDENWGLKTLSKPRYEWRKKPKLGFSLLKLSVTSLLTPFIDRALISLSLQVDQALQRLIPLSRWVKEAWKTGQQALVLPADMPFYLLLRPHPGMLSLEPIQATETHLETYLNLGLRPLLRLGPLVERTSEWNMRLLGEVPPESPHVNGTFRIDYHTLGAFLSEIKVPIGKKGSSLHVPELRLQGEEGQLAGKGHFKLFLQRGRFSTTVSRNFAIQAELDSVDPYPRLRLTSLEVGRGTWWQKRLIGKPDHLKKRVEEKINQALKVQWDYWQQSLIESLADLSLIEALRLQIAVTNLRWTEIQATRRELVGKWEMTGQPDLIIVLPQDWLSEGK